MSSITRNILIIVIIVVVLAVGYFAIFGKKAPSLNLLQKSSLLPDTSQLGIRGEFLSTLLKIKNIEELIKSGSIFFASNSFKNLKDFSSELVSEGKPGRINPFSPLGVDVEATSTPENEGITSGAGTETGTETGTGTETETETETGAGTETETETGTETGTGTGTGTGGEIQ